MNTKIQYFKDFWDDFMHSSNSIERELIHSINYSPRVLVKEFIEEIDRNSLSNQKNKRFFIDSFNAFAEIDVQAVKNLSPIITLIQRQFSNKQNYGYLIHLLNLLVADLSDFKLARDSIKELAKILTDEQYALDKERVKNLTKLIINELIYKGYSSTGIQKIIHSIFKGYRVLDAGALITDFPHGFELPDTDTNSHKYKEYCKDVTTYIDNLTDKQRILVIEKYFDIESEKRKFIFQIKGFKGEGINFSLGDVQFYDPFRVNLIKSLSLDSRDDETFGAKEEQYFDNHYYCNAAVSVDFIDYEFAKVKAIEKLEQVIDLLTSRYSSYKVPVSINTEEYYIIDDEGNDIGSGFSNFEFQEWSDSIELNNKHEHIELSQYLLNNLSNKELLVIDKKIIKSMHWNRKAIESKGLNEKLLWHWVALENVFELKGESSTVDSILNIVPKLMAKRQLYRFAWMHFYKFEESCYKRNVDIPRKLKSDIGFNRQKGTKIFLGDFIKRIDELKECIEPGTLLDDQMTWLSKIFQSKSECLELLEDLEKIAYEKLLYVYRARNKVVHNAYVETSAVTSFYTRFIGITTTSVINTFLKTRKEQQIHTLSEAVFNINYEYDKLKLDLKKKGTGILLKK